MIPEGAEYPDFEMTDDAWDEVVNMVEESGVDPEDQDAWIVIFANGPMVLPNKKREDDKLWLLISQPQHKESWELYRKKRWG